MHSAHHLAALSATVILLAVVPALPAAEADPLAEARRREIMGGETAIFDQEARRFFEFVILPAGLVLTLTLLLRSRSSP